MVYIHLNGTNFDRFLDLLERSITVKPLTRLIVVFVETSDSGIRCGGLHVYCHPVEDLSYECQEVSSPIYSVVLAVRK